MIFELYFELCFLAGFMFELEIQERKRFSGKGLIYFRLKHETLIIVALSLLFNFGRISGLYQYRKGERGGACCIRKWYCISHWNIAEVIINILDFVTCFDAFSFSFIYRVGNVPAHFFAQ